MLSVPRFPHTDPTPRPRAPPVHLRVAAAVAATATTSVHGRRNAPPPLGPPDGRIEGTLPRAHMCADTDRTRCAHAKVLNAPHRSRGYKTGYCRYRCRPRYSRLHPHHSQTEIDRKPRKIVAPGTPQDPNTRKTAASSVPQVPDFKTTREPTARNTSKSNPHTPDNLQPNFFAFSETRTIQSTSCPPASLQRRQRDVGAY
ncbi:hypothetical protein BC826DRAFT_512054 [Russula brevipes]|nr:hypothetical protein BC826DRAFT_512054 [Russula brevipes]